MHICTMYNPLTQCVKGPVSVHVNLYTITLSCSQLRVVYPTLCLIALSTTGICQQGLHLSAGYWGILSHSRTRLQCKHRTISVYRVTTHIQQACATDENKTCFVKSHQTSSGRFSLEILYVNIFFWFAGITSRRPFSRGTYF